MKQWFEIDPVSRRVKGWCRSGSATVLPDNTATSEFAECTDADIAQHSDLQNQAMAAGRDALVLHQAGVIALPADARPRFTITANKTDVNADGIDEIVLTFTALRADGTVRNAFTQQVVYEISGRLIALNFTNGVATKNLKMPVSGRFKFGSNRDVKVDAPVNVTVIE